MQAFKLLSICLLSVLTPSIAAEQPAKKSSAPVMVADQDRRDESSLEIEALRRRQTTLEEKYSQAKGFKDADYILKLEEHYEKYYEKVFSAQNNVLWGVGVFSSVMLFIAGRFSVKIFEQQLHSAIQDATRELRVDFDEKLKREVSEMRTANTQQVATSIDELRSETNEIMTRMRRSAHFNQQFIGGVIFSEAKRHDDAIAHYKNAIAIYKKDKKIVTREAIVICIANLFKTIGAKDTVKFDANVLAELKKPEYIDMAEELDLAAASFPRLAPVLLQSKKA